MNLRGTEVLERFKSVSERYKRIIDQTMEAPEFCARLHHFVRVAAEIDQLISEMEMDLSQ